MKMGLFVLIYFGFFLLITAGIILIYLSGVYMLTRSKQPLYNKILLPITTLPFFASPLYLLANYYHTNPDMIYARGFFGLAPRVHQAWEFDISQNEKLLFEMDLDYNTGARGGAFVDQGLYYVKNGDKKEIDISVNSVRSKGDPKSRFSYRKR